MDKPRRFTFDPLKNRRNVAERGIDFVQAKEFDFSTAIVATDDRKDYGEVREVAAGFVGQRLHIIVFTMRGGVCHIISLRKANKREIKTYVQKTTGLERGGA